MIQILLSFTMQAYIEKDPNFQNPNYVPVTKETLDAAENKYFNNKKRQQQLKDGRTLSKISFFSNLEDLEEEESGALVYDQATAQGQPIPDSLGPFPKHLLGKPVDEIDRARKTERVSIPLSRFNIHRVFKLITILTISDHSLYSVSVTFY